MPSKSMGLVSSCIASSLAGNQTCVTSSMCVFLIIYSRAFPQLVTEREMNCHVHFVMNHIGCASTNCVSCAYAVIEYAYSALQMQ